MDVFSLNEARILAAVRKLPPQLDAVIEKAKREREAEAAAAETAQVRKNHRRRLRKAGSAAAMVAASHGDAPPSAAAALPASRRPRARAYTADAMVRRVPASGTTTTPSSARTRKARAQVIQDQRSSTFGSSAALFNGRRRLFPHEIDQGRMRVELGAAGRTAHINAELRAAREAKFEKDVRKMEELEKLTVTTMLRQADGAQLRYGRLDSAWDGRLQFAAPMSKRGQIVTWNWTVGFHVLTEGLLHEFADSSLTSPLVACWPVLGAVVRKGTPSSQQHPYVLELHLNAFFGEESILSVVEFSAESAEARSEWIRQLGRAALGVSPLFQQTADRQSHIDEVDLLETAAAYATVRADQGPGSRVLRASSDGGGGSSSRRRLPGRGEAARGLQGPGSGLQGPGSGLQGPGSRLDGEEESFVDALASRRLSAAAARAKAQDKQVKIVEAMGERASRSRLEAGLSKTIKPWL